MSQASLVRPTEQIAEFFARGPSPEEIAAFRLPDETLATVRELLYKNSAGTLTAEDAQELDELVLLDRIVNLIRSRVHMPQPQAPQSEQQASDDPHGSRS